MGSHNENWSFWSMDRNWAEPEFKSSMLVSESDIPDEEVYSSVGQEKLQYMKLYVWAIYSESERENWNIWNYMCELYTAKFTGKTALIILNHMSYRVNLYKKRRR